MVSNTERQRAHCLRTTVAPPEGSDLQSSRKQLLAVARNRPHGLITRGGEARTTRHRLHCRNDVSCILFGSDHVLSGVDSRSRRHDKSEQTREILFRPIAGRGS